MFQFFIDRPIFSSVISIVIIIAGLVALLALPVEQYPDVVPPQVVVTATYPGASARVMAESVAAPLEQEINGVEDMIYMESVSTDAGSLRIRVSFEIGTDPDQASINVNNRVQAALPRLPAATREQGIRVQALSTDILMVIVLYSERKEHDPVYISNYALLNVVDELVRLPGVGDASLFGSKDYSMRVWMDPEKMAQYRLTPSDIASAIREQNVNFAAGQIGAAPVPEGQAFTYALTTRGQLKSPKEFDDIILRADGKGATLRLSDVARTELGAKNYAFSATYNARSAVPMGIYLEPGANALNTANAVMASLKDMESRFPEGLKYTISYDTTEFVKISIREVLLTLLIAIVLVVLVTFVFLQHVRATLIPVVAIPVSLIGAFAGMLALGFSINLLTLFGLVLAIGIVVDDAILVMENVDRLMREQGFGARDASVETMNQVAGAVIATTMVLVAVFSPVAFLGGLSGVLYRQFAVTIVVAVCFSSVVALTLTPALCALLLGGQRHEIARPFQLFNRGLSAVTSVFMKAVDYFIAHAFVGLSLFTVVLVGILLLFNRLPSGLVPQEDQGSLMVTYKLPAASALGRTEEVRDRIAERLIQMEEIDQFTAFAGFDIIASSLRTNAGVGFADLSDWDKRQGKGKDALSLARRITGMDQDFLEAQIVSFLPPPIQGLSLTGGVEGYLQVRGDPSPQNVRRLADRLMEALENRPEVTNARATLDTNIPKLKATLDREKARAMNIPVNMVFEAMQSAFGSLYINDFTLSGRTWQVNIQAEGVFRDQTDDLRRIFVRSQDGGLVPLSSLVTLERIPEADIIERFNVYAASKIMADPAPGYTTGQVKDAIEEAWASSLDIKTTLVDWIGEAYQIEVASGTGSIAFALGLVMVFLILAAQYERWLLPLAVASAVPFGALGAVIFSLFRGVPNDIYFQVGILVLIGLSSKNAILIVEFAAQNKYGGMKAPQAASAAARQRFRAIMMTALTFIVGTLPLLFASGAGANSRRELGTVIVGGMILASSLALVFVPLAFRLVEDFADWLKNIRGKGKPDE